MPSGESLIREQLVIPGELASLERVHRWSLAQLGALGLSQAMLHNILLATSEAVTNAIRHGSREEATKLVLISIEATPHSVAVAVEDEGEGFDPDAIPDPTEGDRLYQTGGRGVFLLRSLASNFQISHSRTGTKVMFSFVRN
jgi:serine/threonine-protein kinase RsbW